MPLLIAGLLFLIVYAIPIAWPNASAELLQFCLWAQKFIWTLFLVDYLVSLTLAPQKFEWIKGNLISLLAVALPAVRPLRALRALVAMGLVTKRSSSLNRRRSLLVSVGTTAFATWLVAGLAIVDAERGQPGSNINGVVDGWWWAISTLTTVGYGDKYPVTPTGRLVGIAVMVAGIALFGTLTAGLASYFVSLFEEEQEETRAAISEDREMLERILKEIQGINSSSPKEHN